MGEQVAMLEISYVNFALISLDPEDKNSNFAIYDRVLFIILLYKGTKINRSSTRGLISNPWKWKWETLKN